MKPPPAEITERAALLRRLPYFAALDAPTLQAVAASTVRRTVGAGEIVMIEGEPCAGLFVVQSGRVKITRTSLAGRNRFCTSPVRAKPLTTCRSSTAGRTGHGASHDRQHALGDRSRHAVGPLRPLSRLAQAVVAVLAARCRQLVAMIEDLSLHSVTARLAGLLLDQAAQTDAPTLTAPRWQPVWAQWREMVSRSLRELEQDGLIRLEGARIVITDRAGLARRAER